MSTGSARMHAVAAVVVLLAAPQGQAQVARRVPEQVVVSASARPLEVHKAGSTLDVVTADELAATRAQYVADALRHVPGIAVSRSGSFGGQTQLRLRGGEANHVLVLIDGVEVADASSGEFDLSSLLTSGVERVEVIRGPQSGLHGSNAMGGVVNVVTRSGTARPGIDLSLEAGSFDTAQFGLEAAGSNQRRSGAIALAYRETDGINTAPIGSERDGDRNLSLTGRGAIELSETLTLESAFRLADKESQTDGFDFTGGPNQGLAIDTDDYSNTTDAHLTARATWSAGEGRWITELSGAYFDGEREGGVTPFGAATVREQLRLQSTRALGRRPGGLEHSITGFVDSKDESYRNTAPTDPSQIPEQSRSLLGIGAEYRLELGDGLFVSAVVRDDDNEGFEDAATQRLTVAYAIPGGRARIHGSYGTGVTNPTFFEQFGFTPGVFVGNPDLDPEHVTGRDLGIEYAFAGGLTVDVTYFEAKVESEIVNVFPSVANDPGTSTRDGVELSVHADLTDRLSFSTAYTYTDAENTDGSPEVRRPSRTASADLGYRLASGRARVYAGVVHNGPMYDDDFRNFFANGFMSERTRLDGYTLVDIGGSYAVSDRFELYGRIENLLDEDYVSVIGFATPGRRSYVGFRYRLGR